MWRPENWVNPYWKPTKPEGETEFIVGHRANAYEAGADAILQELKENNNLGYCMIKGMGPGWQVFIPDEKTEATE